MKNIDETVRKCMTIMMKHAYFRNTWHSSKTACACVRMQWPGTNEIQASTPVQAIAYHCISLHSNSQQSVLSLHFLPETVCDITPAQNILLIFAACFCGPALMKIHGLRSIDPDRT